MSQFNELGGKPKMFTTIPKNLKSIKKKVANARTSNKDLQQRLNDFKQALGLTLPPAGFGRSTSSTAGFNPPSMDALVASLKSLVATTDAGDAGKNIYAKAFTITQRGIEKDISEMQFNDNPQPIMSNINRLHPDTFTGKDLTLQDFEFIGPMIEEKIKDTTPEGLKSILTQFSEKLPKIDGGVWAGDN